MLKIGAFHASAETAEDECVVPQWAIDIGHEEMWKSHNDCD